MKKKKRSLKFNIVALYEMKYWKYLKIPNHRAKRSEMWTHGDQKNIYMQLLAS